MLDRTTLALLVSTVFLAAGSPSRAEDLFPERTFATGYWPVSISVADLDGDGHLDVVVPGDGDVSVLLGSGDGRFVARRRYPGGDRPLAVAVADVDGDGNPDLAVANGGSHDVSVLLGHGDGTFGRQRRFAAGESPSAVSVGDLDADGAPDLAVTNSRSNDVSVLLGSGDGTFAIELRCATGDAPRGIALEDLDGDGVLDLVVANTLSRDVSVLSGRGDGTFVTERRFEAGDDPSSLATGDFNGDGVVDLATGGSLLLGAGDGTYSAPQPLPMASRHLTVADFDRDGKPDLAGARCAISVALGFGQGAFHLEQEFPVLCAGSVAAGDFDEDGALDLVAGSYFGRISVLLGRGNGRFATARTNTEGAVDAVDVGDIDADGILDLVAVNRVSDEVSVLRGAGNGGFTESRSYPTGDHPSAVEIADLDRDGNPDLVVTNRVSGDVSVLLGLDNGTFTPEQRFPVGWGPMALTVGDVDRNEIPDLVIANPYSDDLSVLLGLGDGTFAAESRLGAGGGPLSVTLGDFDGNGTLDIATANVLSGDVSVLLGSGDGAFAPEQRFRVSDARIDSIAVGDLDGNGTLDLVVPGTFLRGIGDGTFSIAEAPPSLRSPLVVHDLNGDGILDVAGGARGVSVALGLGGGTFDEERSYGPNGATSLVVGDVDGNGSPDLVAGWYTLLNQSPTRRCGRLGDGVAGSSRLDAFSFTAERGQRVTITLEASGGGEIESTTPILAGPMDGADAIEWHDRTSTPGRLTATLPESGQYHIGVVTRPRSSWFPETAPGGDYCLAVDFSPGAAPALRSTPVDDEALVRHGRSNRFDDRRTRSALRRALRGG